MSRAFADSEETMHVWNGLKEAVTVICVITNTYLLYVFTDIYSVTFEEVFATESGLIVYIIVALEHAIILILVLIKFGIADVPGQVVKYFEW